MQANRCQFCGAHEDESLLGASIKWVGGRGNQAFVHCRDELRCEARKDAKESGPAVRSNRAA